MLSYTDRFNTFLENFIFDTDALARLREIIEPSTHACLLTYISGDTGVGKSHLIKSLADDYDVTHVDCQPNLSIANFYDQLLDAHFANDIDGEESLVYRRHQVEKILGQVHKALKIGVHRKSIIAIDNANKLSPEVLEEVYYLHDRLKTHSFIFILPNMVIDKEDRMSEHLRRYKLPNLSEYKRWNTLETLSRLFPEDLLFADVLKSIANETATLDHEGDIVYKGNVSSVYLPTTPKGFITKIQIACGMADANNITPNITTAFFPHLTAIKSTNDVHLDRLSESRAGTKILDLNDPNLVLLNLANAMQVGTLCINPKIAIEQLELTMTHDPRYEIQYATSTLECQTLDGDPISFPVLYIFPDGQPDTVSVYLNRDLDSDTQQKLFNTIQGIFF